MLAVAKITAKGQTTIPQDIRSALHVGPGDLIAWEIAEDGSARVRRMQPLDCPIADLASAGLPAPSKVRFKLFTLDHRLVRGVLGRLSAGDEASMRKTLAVLLGDSC